MGGDEVLSGDYPTKELAIEAIQDDFNSHGFFLKYGNVGNIVKNDIAADGSIAGVRIQEKEVSPSKMKVAIYELEPANLDEVDVYVVALPAYE